MQPHDVSSEATQALTQVEAMYAAATDRRLIMATKALRLASTQMLPNMEGTHPVIIDALQTATAELSQHLTAIAAGSPADEETWQQIGLQRMIIVCTWARAARQSPINLVSNGLDVTFSYEGTSLTIGTADHFSYSIAELQDIVRVLFHNRTRTLNAIADEASNAKSR